MLRVSGERHAPIPAHTTDNEPRETVENTRKLTHLGVGQGGSPDGCSTFPRWTRKGNDSKLCSNNARVDLVHLRPTSRTARSVASAPTFTLISPTLTPAFGPTFRPQHSSRRSRGRTSHARPAGQQCAALRPRRHAPDSGRIGPRTRRAAAPHPDPPWINREPSPSRRRARIAWTPEPDAQHRSHLDGRSLAPGDHAQSGHTPDTQTREKVPPQRPSPSRRLRESLHDNSRRDAHTLRARRSRVA